MEIFAPGDRVVAINTDLSAPIAVAFDCSIHPFLFPDGPLRKNVVYHVEATRRLASGRQGVFLTGMRVQWGKYDVPWDYSRFRKVDMYRDHASRKLRREQPAAAKHPTPALEPANP